MKQNTLLLKEYGISFSNEQPMVLVGGCNVLESAQLADEVAGHFSEVTKKLNIPWVFKSSFDKANRSSINSFRGLGIDKGMSILNDIKQKHKVAIITDVHEPQQAEVVSEVADIIQLPAFLSRQTDLVQAIAKTNAIINIKKAQFLAPQEMQHIVNKCKEAGNSKVMLSERGSSFGYNNLIVDFLGFDIMKKTNCPIIFDVTHSLQKPGGRLDSADGRRSQVLSLAKAGISQKIAGLFIEAHPNPDKAKCDGPCALPLNKLENFLEVLKSIDDLVKQQPNISFDN